MATTTPNLQLTKPAATDFYDIAVGNENLDKIDTKFGSIDETVTTLESDIGAITAALPKNAYTEVTKEITTSGTWTVPEGVHEVEVMLFGGGGAGYYRQSGSHSGGGGGSGYMNHGKFYVTPGQQIPITIGAGATDYSSDGGATSFGDMLSANGGQSGSSYKGGDGFAGGGGCADSSGNVPYRFAGHGVGGGDGGWGGNAELLKGISTATAQGGGSYISSSQSGPRAGGGGGGMNGGNGGDGGPSGGGGGGGYGTKKLTSTVFGGTGYGAGGGGGNPAGAPGICVLKHALPIGGQIFSPAMSPTSFEFTSGSSSGIINVTGLSPTATIKLETADTAFKVGGTNTVGGTVTVTDGKIIVKNVASWSGTRTAMVAVEDSDSLAFYTQKYFTITVTM